MSKDEAIDIMSNVDLKEKNDVCKNIKRYFSYYESEKKQHI